MKKPTQTLSRSRAKKSSKPAEPSQRLTVWLELSQYIVLAVLLFFVILYGQKISNLQAQVDGLEIQASR